MKKNRLGQSEILVSELCLGTMTLGTQTNENDAHEQIDLALESGINFIDTAEMYPVLIHMILILLCRKDIPSLSLRDKKFFLLK